jgi:hypothetical protein
MTRDEERDRIVFALDNAVEEAQAFGQGDHDEFRELVKHAREMHDILLQALRQHPRLDTAGMALYVTSTRDRIRELELLAGASAYRDTRPHHCDRQE